MSSPSSSSSSSSLFSSTKFIDHGTTVHSISTTQNEGEKCRANLKKPVLLYPAMTPPSNDFILFPDTVIVEKHSSTKTARARDAARSSSTSTSMSLSSSSLSATPNIYRTMSKDVSPSNANTSIKRSKKTKNLIDQKVVADQRRNDVPPPAPTPPRLATPDVTDVDEDELWSCCRSSESDDLDSILARAEKYQAKARGTKLVRWAPS